MRSSALPHVCGRHIWLKGLKGVRHDYGARQKTHKDTDNFLCHGGDVQQTILN
jgi:hypothetical protein